MGVSDVIDPNPFEAGSSTVATDMPAWNELRVGLLVALGWGLLAGVWRSANPLVEMGGPEVHAALGRWVTPGLVTGTAPWVGLVATVLAWRRAGRGGRRLLWYELLIGIQALSSLALVAALSGELVVLVATWHQDAVGEILSALHLSDIVRGDTAVWSEGLFLAAVAGPMGEWQRRASVAWSLWGSLGICLVISLVAGAGVGLLRLLLADS